MQKAFRLHEGFFLFMINILLVSGNSSLFNLSPSLMLIFFTEYPLLKLKFHIFILFIIFKAEAIIYGKILSLLYF